MTAEVDQEVVEQLWALLDAQPGLEITVDLQDKQIRAGELTADFTIDEYVRWRLLEGLDDIGITLQHSDEIAAFEQERPGFLPTTA